MKPMGLNIIEAVQTAQSGKKIRRASWLPGEAIYHSSDRFRFASDDRLYENFLAYDIRADDWEIVPEPPKTMTFMEAWTAMKEGKKVKRLEMPQIYRIDKHEIFRQDCHTSAWYCAGLHFIDIEATDWIVVEETTNQQEANNE